jgi:hypothetical protein
MITWYRLLPARPQDIQLLDDLIESFAEWVVADKGFIDAFRQAILEERARPAHRDSTAQRNESLPALVIGQSLCADQQAR